MSLLSPMMLYLFGLAGVIIAFYFLKRRVKLLPVSALFLWQKAAERPKSALRLLWSSLFLLFLQLLALALLVGALANPVFYTQASGPKRLALILDGSLSMQTKTVSRLTSLQVRKSQVTRYDEAVAKAIEIINESPAAQITVIQAQAQSVVLSPLSRHRAEILNTLRRSRPTFQGDAAFKELLELLKSQAPLESFDKIVFLTDHTPKDELWKDLGIELVLIGAPFDPAAVPPRNVGITYFAVRRQPIQLASLQVNKSTSLEHSLLVTLENFSMERAYPHLKISAGDEIVSEADIVIEKETRQSYEFSYSGAARLFKAEIALEDDLEADNIRYFALPTVPKARILWLGDENPFLKSALSVLGDFVFEQSENHDLVVANNTRFTQPAEGNLLLINAELPNVVEFVNDEKEPKEWRVKVTDHPLLKGLDTGEFFTAPFQRAKVSQRGQIVVSAKTDSDEYPLLYLYQDGRLRLVWLGLDLRYANLVLSLDFPILIKNIISWLLSGLYSEKNLAIGDGISAVGLPKDAQLINPQGQIVPLSGAFLDTYLPGFYKIITQDHVLTYAVNSPAAESDVRPGPLPSPRSTPQGGIKEFKLANPLWQIFVLGGLILLLLELYFYNPSLLQSRRVGR